MARLFLVTHTDVVIDPCGPVDRWKLSDMGRARSRAFATSGVLAKVKAIWSSTEVKAIETAGILAGPLGLPVSTDARLGENDRTATGFLPREEFEAAADRFFAAPEESFRGWERAVDAQKRIERAVREILAAHPGGDLAVVSHGAVGTLLYCALKGLAIDRKHDQPFQGHYWAADLPGLVVRHGWREVGRPGA